MMVFVVEARAEDTCGRGDDGGEGIFGSDVGSDDRPGATAVGAREMIDGFGADGL